MAERSGGGRRPRSLACRHRGLGSDRIRSGRRPRPDGTRVRAPAEHEVRSARSPYCRKGLLRGRRVRIVGEPRDACHVRRRRPDVPHRVAAQQAFSPESRRISRPVRAPLTGRVRPGGTHGDPDVGGSGGFKSARYVVPCRPGRLGEGLK